MQWETDPQTHRAPEEAEVRGQRQGDLGQCWAGTFAQSVAALLPSEGRL